MKLKDLIDCIHDGPFVNLAILDDSQFVCTAPATGVALKPYHDRDVAFIDIYKHNEEDKLTADLIITLEIQQVKRPDDINRVTIGEVETVLL